MASAPALRLALAATSRETAAAAPTRPLPPPAHTNDVSRIRDQRCGGAAHAWRGCEWAVCGSDRRGLRGVGDV